jgi:hypothetical protein
MRPPSASSRQQCEHVLRVVKSVSTARRGEKHDKGPYERRGHCWAEVKNGYTVSGYPARGLHQSSQPPTTTNPPPPRRDRDCSCSLHPSQAMSDPPSSPDIVAISPPPSPRSPRPSKRRRTSSTPSTSVPSSNSTSTKPASAARRAKVSVSAPTSRARVTERMVSS